MPEGHKTILVVDDDRVNRTLLTRVLEKKRHRVITAGDGNEALQILSHTPVDLVTLDADMPVMDGFTACRRIRRDPELSRLPVIMVTGFGGAEEIRKGFNAGVSEYLVKPVRGPELLNVVEAYFTGSLSEAGQIAVLSRDIASRAAVLFAVTVNHFEPVLFEDLKKLLDSGGGYEMIIVDTRESDTDTDRILRDVKARFINVPLILLSAHADPEFIINAYLRGAADLLIEPFEAQVLATKILALHRSRTFEIVQEENRVKNSRISLLRELQVTLSHYVNNILSSMKLNLQYLSSKCVDEDLADVVRKVSHDAGRIANVLNKLERLAKEDDIPLEDYLGEIKMLKL
jgi:DNA-binding response OmpR family regulator